MKKKTNSPQEDEVRKRIEDDPDLFQMFYVRVEYRMRALFNELWKRIADKKKLDGQRVEKLGEMYRQVIIEKEVLRFANEAAKYQRKHKRSYFDDIEKARKGDNEALFFLLEWDKSWIMIKPIQEKLIQAQEQGDFDFMENCGRAIQKQPGSNSKPRKAKDKELIDLLKVFADRHFVEMGSPEYVKGMHDFLKEIGIISDENIEDDKGKADFDYFVKWLKRHNVIP